MPDPATQKKQITTQLSSRQVTLSASQSAVSFYATVYNDSDRFASFQLKLLAAGVQANANKPWYRLMPSVSAKIPVGDCTRFQVEIFDLPPIAQQFRGSIDLTVEVTSRELDNQYDRQPLRLQAEGLQGEPPDLTLIAASLQANPGERVAIVGQVHNPTPSALEITLKLQGLPELWFPNGTQQTLSLPAGKLQRVAFECEVPPPMQAPSRFYPLLLDATGRFPTVITPGQLHILPAGTLFFNCDPLETTIPERLGRWQNPTQGSAGFMLQLDNQTNLEPSIQIRVNDLHPHRQRAEGRRWFWQNRTPDAPAPLLPLATGLSVGELPIALPVGLNAIPLQIQRKLPWLGWARLQRFEVMVESPELPVAIQPDRHILQIHLFPVIPFWLQLLGALLTLGLGALAWFLLTDPGHRGPVTSVQFSGQGTEVLSGSDDQTIRRWRIYDQSLRTQNRIGNLNKAVRVVRYRPVNNDQVAIGFENGEIQLANLLTGQRSRLTPDKDDRVFDLVFSRDARTLYSAHGSGLILQWDMTHLVPEQTTPQRAYDTRFAIEALALTGNDDSHLAIGGRYNRFLLLETRQGANPISKAASSKASLFLEVSYPFSGSSTDYISSLSTAEQQPSLLAVADTQGHISVWNTQQCLQNRGRCAAIDKPWLGHAGSPVRAVALSANGCFLASGGDDGQVKLWALDGQGVRRSSSLEGRVLERVNQPLNTVDVIQTRDGVWVTSGGDDGRVRLDRVPFEGDNQPSDRCPVLAGGGS